MSALVANEIELGQSGIRLLPLGVGTWPWGDRRVWKFDPVSGPRDAGAAFHAALDRGVTLFDTAEIYGGGDSERLLGRFIRESGRRPLIATKFAPLPWRLTPRSLTRALERSLARLGVERIDLYQVHWPFTHLSIESLMDEMARAAERGLIRAVGVSNCNAARMRRAHAALAARGIPLAANQVSYHLLDRAPESNGVLAASAELRVALIAYSPLATGTLTGKYRPGDAAWQRAGRARRLHRNFRRLPLAAPVIAALTDIARRRGVTPAQVALGWLLAHPGVIPIPSARNAAQAAENAGALSLSLDAGELAALERAAPGRRAPA